MKIVKKTNGNIVILNTDGTVKQVIQQTGVQLLLEGNEIKLIQNGYPIGYIAASDVTHTQIEPAAQVAFSGDNSALMTLLAEDFFVLSTAVDSEGWIETEIDISDTQLKNDMAAGITLLAVPGVGKYYEYSIILEYTHVATAYTFADDLVVGDIDTYAGNYLSGNMLTSTDDSIYFASSQAVGQEVGQTAGMYVAYQYPTNKAIKLFAYSSTNPTLGDGTIKAKIKYKIETFG